MLQQTKIDPHNLARVSSPASILALLLAIVAALGAFSWLAWEVVAHWFHFDGYFANGAFQLLNPLRRTLDGQTYARDFLNFQGIGTVWLHFPTYVFAGADLRASELARFTTSGMLHAVAAVALARAFSSIFDGRRVTILFALLFFAAGPFLFSQTFFPSNSIMGVRSFFPLMVGVALARSAVHARTDAFLWIALALAASVLASVEHGLAAACGLAMTLLVAFLCKQSRQVRYHLIGGRAVGLIVFAVVLFIVTGGAVGRAMQYSLSDIPADQFWYFGSPPNGFLPRDWRAIIVYAGYIRFDTKSH